MDQIGATALAEPPAKTETKPLRAEILNGRVGGKSAGADKPCHTENRTLAAITPDDHRALMIAVANRQDRQAFAALFGHFAPRVKAYLIRSGSPADSAEELAQEALATVWRRAESFDPDNASVATWIFTIARNKRIDMYRRTNRPELDPDDPALVPAEEAAPDVQIQGKEVSKAITAAVKTLPMEQAEMLRMAFFEDKAHSEIAEETGLPLGTVKSRLRLAIARMRKELKELEQ